MAITDVLRPTAGQALEAWGARVRAVREQGARLTATHLTHLPISRFNPFAGTPMAQVPRASPWEAARLCAVARLVLRTPDIRIAAGGNPDDIPLWLMAGGNRITSVFIHQRKTEPERFTGENPQVIRRRMVENIEVVDRSSVCRRFAEELGFAVLPITAG